MGLENILHGFKKKLITSAFLGSLLIGCGSDGPTQPPPLPPLVQCNDKIDNDGDGLTDYPNDPGCLGAKDTDEYNAPLTLTALVSASPSIGFAPITTSIIVSAGGTASGPIQYRIDYTNDGIFDK